MSEILFVCWGNICRSPMAERVAKGHADREGLSGVRFTSAGVSSEEAGHAIDPRAAAVLRQAGYTAEGHRAQRVTVEDIRRADIVVAMEQVHLDRLRQLAPDARNLFLLSEFDPEAAPGSEVPDPWYGSASGFGKTLASIEAAIPELLRRARELV